MLKLVRIGDFLHRHKEVVKIDPDKEYSLVTVKLHHNGVVLRENKRGSLLGSNMYRIKKGQFILSGIDARNGAFGIVPEELDGAIITNYFWCFDVDETQVKRDFFFWLSNTSLFLDACQKASKGETQRIRLQRELFENIVFQFPPIAEQETFLHRIAIYDTQLSSLNGEQVKQSEYLTSLRQSVLQEAIEGKLTADWRKQHPFRAGDPDRDGAALLEKIREEKKKLVAEGKIRKEKSIAPMAAGEELIELPVGWVWTRLWDIAEKIQYGISVPSNPNVLYPKLLRITDIYGNSVDWESVPGCLCDEKQKVDFLLNENDIVIARTGGTIGTSHQIKGLKGISVFASYLIRIVIKCAISSDYLSTYLGSRLYWKQLESAAWGAGQPNVSGSSLARLLVPLPPLAEQAAIVERVEALLAHVDELEKEVAARKGHTEELMREVLREAFE